MPTICRCRPARCTPTSSARRIRTPTSSRSTPPTALAKDGVWAVITGEDVKKISDPFLVALKSPIHQWSLAVDRVRFVGEPVALVVAESRYLAEDAAELVADRICAARSGDRSARGVQAVIADPARRGQDQRDFGPQIPLRRHQERVREGRQGRQADGGLSPALVHADGMLRRRRHAQSGRRQLRLHGEFPGAVLDASGDGARAARAGPEDAAAHSAGLRRQLRHQALGVSLCGADRARGEDHRPHGEMGRGPRRASACRKLRAEPRHRDRGGGDQGRQDPRAEDGSARGLRRVPARADARAALPHARRGDRRLRHRQRRCDQPRRADQQDAGEPHSRLRRAAALSGAGAAGAADRGRAWARSSRRDPAQPRAERRISLQGRGRRARTTPAIIRARSRPRSATAASNI